MHDKLPPRGALPGLHDPLVIFIHHIGRQLAAVTWKR